MATYRSSPEKDIVRDRFDLPLIKGIAKGTKDRCIRYFGLPGVQALDLECWGDLCKYVAAVERSKPRFRQLQRRLATEYGQIRSRTYQGDVDSVILRNGSRHSGVWQYVSTAFREELGYYTWDFDVVYLDYFGKFLPYDHGEPTVRNRARALRELFSSTREDAWKRWLLIITVESQLFGEEDLRQMRQFLESVKAEANTDNAQALEYMLDPDLPQEAKAARLIHSTLAYLVSSAVDTSNAKIAPRPTVLYQGSGTPMLHYACEVMPAAEPIGHQSALPLLRAPMLCVRDPSGPPWFELLPNQPPGQTANEVRSALDFLEPVEIDAVINGRFC